MEMQVTQEQIFLLFPKPGEVWKFESLAEEARLRGHA